MHPEFGIFEPVFESPHGYLALLGLHSSDAIQAVELVRNCCRQAPNPSPDICKLLADANWRPHLVAAAAVIVSGYNSESIKNLWRRMDSGSWVIPQIGVALYLTDPDFLPQARTRLEARCPLDVSDLLAMSDVERHSAAGPAGKIQRSAKAAATLLYLLQLAAPAESWIQEVRAAPDMQALLAEDFDAAHLIAEKWLEKINEIRARLQ
jgi:hypothetical protein